MPKKNHAGLLAMSALFVLSSCGGSAISSTSGSAQVSSTAPTTSATSETVAVKELTIALAKANAKVGEHVGVTVQIKPTNATNKEYSLASSDETVAKIENGEAVCLKAGSVTITARSKENASKKAEAKLTVLATDSEGRSENLFEAETGNILPSEGSSLKAEATSDERVSGGAVVSHLAKGDRIIWGINASAKDDNADLKIRLMGPSGWLGMWDSIPYCFADWYTLKLNGVIVPTENIQVAGTTLKGSSADYYAMQTLDIGKLSLKEGLNVLTFVVSNRYDQTSINDGTYSGTLSCWGNLDCVSVFSSKDLTYVANTAEVTQAEEDAPFIIDGYEAEAPLTRVYESAEKTQVDLGSATAAEFKEGMHIVYGLHSDKALRFRLALKIAAPYINTSDAANDLPLAEAVEITLNDRLIDLSGMTLLGNGAIGKKDNFSQPESGWLALVEGDNVIDIAVKAKASAYAYLGALDAIALYHYEGNATAFLAPIPTPSTTIRLEAESATTKRVGYADLAATASYLELTDAHKVETTVYKNKIETTKVIYGVTSDKKATASLTLRMATPYLDAATPMSDVSLGDLGDLWVNGTLVSTPLTLLGNNQKGSKDNFTSVSIEISLEAGKNRIAWEPQNYTGNAYAYFGAMDYIELTSKATVSPYLVNFYTDRNTYFDDGRPEPIYVTCDSVSSTSPNSCWFGLFHAEDTVETACPGSLYWYYPTNSAWNSDQTAYLGSACNILLQNPNSERALISATTGGYYKVVYMEKDSKNADKGYDVTDVVYISVWNDPSVYGGAA